MALVAASCLFLAAMVHAAITDFRRHRMLNVTVIALAVAYLPMAMAVGLDWMTIVSAVVATLLVFVIGFGAFCANWVGGGDIKLATVTTLWIGAEMVLPFLLLAGLFGLVLSVLFRVMQRWQTGAAPDGREIPYSPGIVLAGFALFSSSQWFTGTSF